VLQCQVTSGQGDQFDIASSAVQAQSLNTEDITAINPPAKPISKWVGQASAGLTSTHGNTTADNFNASFGAQKRTKIDRTTVAADYAKGTQDNGAGGETDTEDWWRAKAKYDYFVTPKWYAFLDGRYGRDAIALVDRRMTVGVGAGWQWLETDITKWAFELGAASLYERFDDVGSTKNSELSVQAGYNLSHRLTKTVDFIHDLTYYPSTDQFSDYFLTSGAEIRTRFSSRMFANFKTLFNYDASPATSKGHTDVKYIVGIGLDF
jgi:putative salt-induced outer membrane protein YdiY